MDGTPLLPANVPRFATRRGHSHANSRSPTRNRFADDILADLSPATTFEAFVNPSGKLKSSIEAATPSERAFGLRATLASKKIQEWVVELSGWPWPADNTSLGFEMPVAKRRKLSLQGGDRGRRDSKDRGTEPQYIGSLLAVEVEEYENRIDEIAVAMEDLDVESIKRQVLDTHFSTRSRPSSSGSNATPPPSQLVSYSRMDDFTAVITATVLRSLPNLSRLTRLLAVWNIRLTILRKVPPLMLALDDAETALKSGWATIQSPRPSTPSRHGQQSGQQSEDQHLSRKSFDIMRNVLQDKVTTLGQELDYMLDTLEGWQDTLPEAWLDRMERIENDYGSWVVSGDRQVREGEWAKMAKARKEEDNASKWNEAEAEENAGRKAMEDAQDAARRTMQQDPENAEAAKLKLERNIEEVVTLKSVGEAREAAAAQTARMKAKEEAQELVRLEASRQAEHAGATRLQMAQEAQAGAVRLRSEQDVTRAVELAAVTDAEIDEAEKLLVEQEAQADAVRIQAGEQIRETAQQKAASQSQPNRNGAESDAQELPTIRAAERAVEASAAHLRAEQAQEEARRHALKVGQEAETTQYAQKEAKQAASRQAEQLEKFQVEREIASAANIRARQIEELVDSQRDQYAEAARPRALLTAEALLVSKRRTEHAKVTQRPAQQSARAPAQSETNSELTALERTKAPPDSSDTELEDSTRQVSKYDADDKSCDLKNVDCHVCVELEKTTTPSPLQPSARVIGSAVSPSAARTQEFVGSLVATDLNNTVDPQISQCGLFDGGYEDSAPVIRNTEIEIFNNSFSTVSPDLASPIHLDDSFPQTPTSPALSSTAKVFNSPTSEDSTSPPVVKVPQFGQTFADFMRTTSQEEVSPRDHNDVTPIPGRPAPAKSLFSNDGANDYFECDTDNPENTTDQRILAQSPHHKNANAEDHDFDLESSRSRPSAISGYATAEPSREHGTQPAKSFTESPSRAPESSTEKSDMTATSLVALATLTPIRTVPSLDGTETPTRPCASFISDISSSNSSHSILSPVAEEKLSQTELQSVDGLCEPCDIAIRELTPREDSNEPGLPILDREVAITPIDRPAQPISIPRSPTSVEVTFHGAADAQYSVSVPLDGRLTRTNNPLSVSYVSSSAINIKCQCLLRTVDDPPILVEGVPGTWMVVPPQSIISISCTSDLPLLPTSFIDHATRGILTPRRDSVASDTSTIVTGRVSESPLSPIGSPISDEPVEHPEYNELSPSKGRVEHRRKKPYKLSPPSSPSGMPIRPAPRLAHEPVFTPPTSTTPSTPLINIPSTPLEAPIFGNLDVATTPLISSPVKANSDEHMQQQISSLLESIPARIRLTSESDGTSPSSHTLRPQRSRRSITPSARSSSSMSNYSTSRAPTPSFTLTPAYGKTSSRIRPPSNNPEIKLYHLSRSTGEAPIKLFVRLVGEHGERVMVRVGGGWADLGEYLKEYASHHGRRVGSTRESADKVEIQDLPPRKISSSSTITPGRSSPALLPQSVLERERPGSSFNLHVRKTRNSLGESSPDPATTRPRISKVRAPSTPLPTTTARRSYETPPSITPSPETGRSSRMSWTDEDSNLGLAGPKSKRVVISERDQEWVESMKEKVRLASAEKAKGKPGGGKGEGNGFGEIDKVGGTKRLFRKGGI
ncbi:GAS2 domain-containing protein [Diplocarpon rosae]|nr:GAS2 domain-containing protein [Diplocarpon rosae]